MDFISRHPGITYLTINIIELLALVVIAGALVSIACSLHKAKKVKE